MFMIYLVRHARPAFDMSRRVARGHLAPLVEAHDRSGIVLPVSPLALGDIGAVFSSDTPRAAQSARAFFPDAEPCLDPVFREAQLPARLPCPVDLRYSTTLVMARCLWLCGYAPETETLREAGRRAGQAAQMLDAAATDHGSVALVGHGFFNRLIGRSLAEGGWKRVSSTGDGFEQVRAYGKKV